MKKKTTKKIENSFSHTGTIGDVWASLPSVKEICRKCGTKAIFYLKAGQLAEYHHEDVIHPTVNDSGEQVMLNEAMIEMMIPLLKAQPYIEDARLHRGEQIRVPMEKIRSTFVNQPYHPLSYWYFYVYPDSFCDVSKPYIFVPDNPVNVAKDKIIVARTERYTNPKINYRFLRAYEDKLLFAGTQLEYVIFRERFGVNIPLLVVKDFLELAQVLKQSLGVISNQTQIMQIAEGMKIKRAVELCKYAPNVTVQGYGGFEFYHQGAAELWVKHTIEGTEISLSAKDKVKMKELGFDILDGTDMKKDPKRIRSKSSLKVTQIKR